MSTFFLQQLINGLTLGSVYGLIAIGYTMVYGIIGMINFAHGEVYMISAYLCAIGLALLSFFGLQSFPLLILGTLVFTIVVTGVYGWTIERIAYKPLRNSTRLAPLISAIGMSLILQNYAQLSQGPRQQGVPTMLDGVIRLHLGDGFVQITYTKVFILVASFAGMLVLTWLINHTPLGRMCRAVQQDRKMASILGINTDRIISLVFVIGAAMAAKMVTMRASVKVIPLGIAMGIIVNVMIFVTDMGVAMALMVLIGGLSGFFVVPMNALLQHRGHILMGAGHSIAVQNFNENLSILIMTGFYYMMIKADLSIYWVITLFALFVSGSMLLVKRRHEANQREHDDVIHLDDNTTH